MPGLSGYLSTTKRAPRPAAGPSSSTWVNSTLTGVSAFARMTRTSVGQALARRGGEHVDLARTRHDVQRGALVRDGAAADADDEVLVLVADLGGAVDVAVGAELLDDVHGD